MQEENNQLQILPNAENAEVEEEQLDFQEKIQDDIKKTKNSKQSQNNNNFDRPRNNMEKTIFVGGLPDRLKEIDLASVFGTFGEIKSVYIPKDYLTGKQKGYAFIEYEDEDDIEHAIQNYDNTEIYGKIKNLTQFTFKIGKVLKVRKAKVNKIQGAGKAIWDVQQNVDEDM